MSEERPPGWRKTWRAPKARRAASKEPAPDVRDVLASADDLPTSEEQRRRALAVLIAIMEDATAQAAVRVGAAKIILDANVKKSPLGGGWEPPPALGATAPPQLTAGEPAPSGDASWK